MHQETCWCLIFVQRLSVVIPTSQNNTIDKEQNWTQPTGNFWLHSVFLLSMGNGKCQRGHPQETHRLTPERRVTCPLMEILSLLLRGGSRSHWTSPWHFQHIYFCSSCWEGGWWGGWGAITLSPYRMPYLTCLKGVRKFISVSKNKIPVAAEEMRLESLMNSLPGHKVGPK